jgi:hypothetical protein
MPYPTFPIEDPKSPAAQEAAELHQRAHAAAQVAHALEHEQAAAQEDVRRLSAELEAELRAVALKGGTGSRKAATLGTRLAEAKAKAAEPWIERIRAAHAAAEQFRWAYAAFVDEHFDALHAEFHEAAHASRERIAAAAEEMAAAFAAYRDVASRVEALTTHATHLEPRDVAAPPPSAPGKRRSFHAVAPRVEDPTAAMLERLGDDLDAALPLPLVGEQALQWRADRLAGVELGTSKLTAC